MCSSSFVALSTGPPPRVCRRPHRSRAARRAPTTTASAMRDAAAADAADDDEFDARDAAGNDDDRGRIRRRRRAVLSAAMVMGVPVRAGQAKSGQPIDWLLQSATETDGDDVDLGEIIKAAAKGEISDGRRAKTPPPPTTTGRGVGGGGEGDSRDSSDAGSSSSSSSSSGAPADVKGTATKFGKLGVILVLADVVTAAIMGKSVLGVAKSLEREMEIGEDGNMREVVREEKTDGPKDWKEKMAEKIMKKMKENESGPPSSTTRDDE